MMFAYLLKVKNSIGSNTQALIQVQNACMTCSICAIQ